MSNLISTMTRLSTAMTLFGVQQLQKSVTVIGDGAQFSKAVDDLTKAVNSLTDALTDKMEGPRKETLESVTKMAEKAVQSTVNSLGAFGPGELIKGTTQLVEKARDLTAGVASRAIEKASDAMQPTPAMLSLMTYTLPSMTRAISLSIPGRSSEIAALNANNNAEIIQLVVNVSSILPPPGVHVPLGELVDKCYDMGTFPALWAVEGLGHYYGDTFYERNEVPYQVLTDPKLKGLPAKSMTMLHAGIGLSFAQQNLLKLSAKSPAAEIRKTVARFIDLCKNSSREGYTGAAYESLGLVSRNFHGLPMMRAVDEALAQVDPTLTGYLWRGAGRAVYFSVPNFIPGLNTPWRAIDMCRDEPSNDLGRRNMLAGFAWATTVVNMRHPQVMETVLKYHGRQFSEVDAFSNGVMCAMMMRFDTSPDDPNIESFRKYRPSDPGLVQMWNDLISGPCDRALQEYYPVLKTHKRLEEIFRYQDLGALVASLKKPAAKSKEAERLTLREA